MIRIEKLNIFSGNRFFISFIAVFLFGFVFGTVNVSVNSQTQSYLSAGLIESIQKNCAMPFFQLFLELLIPWLVPLLLQYIFGLSAVGTVPTFILPFFKGLSIGSYISILYITYSFLGVIYAFIAVILPLVIYLFAMSIAGKEAFNFSVLIFKFIVFRANNASQNNLFKKYNIKFLILSCILIVASIINAVVIYICSGLLK